MLHRLKDIWGADAEEFNPDHFEPQRRDALPPNAYKPFGSGQRACIGRQFALQEATLVLGMLLQRFEFVDHANYQLKIKESLTIKPDGLTITVRPRSGRTWGATPRPGAAAATPRTPALAVVPADRHGTPLLVLFGSNLGGSEDIASRIAREATDRGYTARTAGLDSAVGELPTEGAVVVVTSSYNGQPPDNAATFCAWADDAATSLAGVRYTVFGCGNRDWAATYQAVPTRLDAALEDARRHAGVPARRGRRPRRLRRPVRGLVRRAVGRPGFGPRARRRGDGDGRERPAAGRRPSSSAARRARSCSPTAARRRPCGSTASSRRGRATPGGRSVRHLEITLPSGISYAAGDHLGVLPRNDVSLVNRTIARFGLDAGQYVTITASGAAPTHLPLGEPYPLLGILAGCVELQDVASRAGLAAMAAHLPEGRARDELAGLAGTDDESRARYREKIAIPRRHAARPARGPPRVRPAVRGVPRPPAAAAPAVLLDLLVAGGELRRRADRRRARGTGALRGRLDVPRRVLRAPAGRPRRAAPCSPSSGSRVSPSGRRRTRTSR